MLVLLRRFAFRKHQRIRMFIRVSKLNLLDHDVFNNKSAAKQTHYCGISWWDSNIIWTS